MTGECTGPSTDFGDPSERELPCGRAEIALPNDGLSLIPLDGRLVGIV
jgi:hypothetical protein